MGNHTTANASVFKLQKSIINWQFQPLKSCEPLQYHPCPVKPIVGHSIAFYKGEVEAIVGEVELEALLDCIWERESSRGKNMIGDGGLAIGHYQIHIDKHPISYMCAMDFDCSRDYTRSMILAGNGRLWTGYRKCI